MSGDLLIQIRIGKQYAAVINAGVSARLLVQWVLVGLPWFFLAIYTEQSGWQRNRTWLIRSEL